MSEKPFYASKPLIARIALSTAVLLPSIAVGLAVGIVAARAIPGIPLGGGFVEGNPGAPFVGVATFVVVSFVCALVGLLYLWRS